MNRLVVASISLAVSMEGAVAFTTGRGPVKVASLLSLSRPTSKSMLSFDPLVTNTPRNYHTGPRGERVQTKLQMANAYEALMEKIPSQNVIQAVETSPNGKVVASGKCT